MYACMYIRMHIYICIYIYRERERERERRSKAGVKHGLQVKHGVTLTTPGRASSLVRAMICFTSIKSLHGALIE